MRIEREVRRVHGHVVRDEQPHAVVQRADHTLRAAPEHSVVHDQQVGLGLNHLLDYAPRNVDRRRDASDRSAVRQLYPVQGAGIVGNGRSIEKRVEVDGNCCQIGHWLTIVPAESTSRREPSYSRRLTESIAVRILAGIRACNVGLSTSLTTFSRIPSDTTPGVKVWSFTSFATSKNAWRRSITTLPNVTSGATLFWSALAPITYADLASRAAWKTPSPAASAFWKITSVWRPIWASACSFPALTSSQLPTYDTAIPMRGFTDRAPAAYAAKLRFTGGSSVPPIAPMAADLVIPAARIPARYEASSNANWIPATLGRTVFPDVVTYSVFGNSGATRTAAS